VGFDILLASGFFQNALAKVMKYFDDNLLLIS